MRTLVIGGGITGLTTAFYLKKAGHDVQVFEASERPGGAIQTGSENGWIVEGGPNSINVSDALVTRLIHDIGLDDEAIEADRASARRYLVRDQKVIPAPASLRTAITTPLLSFRAKLRILREPFIAKYSGEKEESLAEMVTRRLGPEPLKYLVNPFVGGIYAGNPEELSVKHAFPRLYQLEQDYGSFIKGAINKGQSGPARRIVSFRGGLSVATQRLADLLGESWHPSTGVTHIEKRPTGYTVNGREFERIIFTAPFYALNSITFDNMNLPPLPEVHYASVISCSMGFRRSDVIHPIDGFGMLVPGCEPFHILGTLFPSAIFPDRTPSGDHVLLTTFIGGSRRPELAHKDDGVVKQLIMEDLVKLLGVRGDPVYTRMFRWPKAIPQYDMQYGKKLKWMDEFESKVPGFHLAGNFKTGISLDACIQSAVKFEKYI